MMTDVLSHSSLKKSGFFNPACVTKLVDEHLRGTENHSHRLWALMVFGIWYDNYLK